MSISPFIRTPFTDLTGGMVNHQYLGRCQKQESRFMECVEAYGLDKGRAKCQDLFNDFHECHTLSKQFKRTRVMRNERNKQVAEGKLTGDHYQNPKIDAY